MPTTKYRKRRGCIPIFISSWNKRESPINLSRLLAVIARLNRITALSILVVFAVPLVSGFTHSAQANATLPLTLSISGANTTTAKKPLAIDLKLSSHAIAVPHSRLRLFIHDGKDRNLNLQTIEIKLQEDDKWVIIPFEPIDGGVMAAIGEAGKGHHDRHGRGGFAMAKNTSKVWHLRLNFGLTGVYSLVVSVSPDNGATQLAKPQSVTIEVL